MLLKKDAKNAANAVKNPGSFETQTQIPPEEGYDFSYHNLVCPLSIFAKKYGYEEYMPYLCNLDNVMFGILGAPLYREHTCFDDGDKIVGTSGMSFAEKPPYFLMHIVSRKRGPAQMINHLERQPLSIYPDFQ